MPEKSCAETVQRIFLDYPSIHTIFLLSDKHRVGTNQRDQMLELKVAKFSPKLSQKVTTLVKYEKICLSHKPKNSFCIWATFYRGHVTKNFQKLPNLVTLVETTSRLVV